MRQYNPKKSHKWGVKFWGLAESATGYVFNLDIYQGRRENPEVGLSHQVVMDISRPILDKGHIIYMDNFFSSPALFSELKKRQTGACGTINVNRRGVPQKIKDAKVSKKDAPVFVKDGDNLFVSWKDTKVVTLVSNCMNSTVYNRTVRAKTQNNQRSVIKPRMVEMYNNYMAGVDRADQRVAVYLPRNRTLKWTKKVFMFLLQVSFTNSLIIFRHLKRGRKVEASDVLKGIYNALTSEGGMTCNQGSRSKDMPTRLVARHFPRINVVSKNGKEAKRLDCIVCSSRAQGGRRCTTKFMCVDCDKPMCAYPCFERYHTLKDYKVQCSSNLHTFPILS